MIRTHKLPAYLPILLACLSSGLLNANPDGGIVVNGNASFNQQGSTLNITNTPGTIINWQKFSIGSDETTKFIQQSTNSAVLNRVVGQDPSAILGTLQSNGRVFIINPNGILFGHDSAVDVGGLVASTLNLSNENFLSQEDNFSGDGTNNSSVVNYGDITTSEGGSVYLIAPNIENHGIITSDKGEVLLAAGHSVQLLNSDNPDIRVTLTAPEGEVLNVGDIITKSGTTSIYAGLINHQGKVNADSAVVNENGKIYFKASKKITLSSSSITSANGIDGGSVVIKTTQGLTEVSGTISALGSNGNGGDVLILGDEVQILNGSTIDAAGETVGGTILLGGSWQNSDASTQQSQRTIVESGALIKANAMTNGDGGTIVAWSDITNHDSATFAYGNFEVKGGERSGNGGRIETSGAYLDVSGININATAANGIGGEWLLDPDNITIDAAGPTTTGATVLPTYLSSLASSVIWNGDINSQLNAGTSITIQTGAGGALNGDITVNAPITKTAGGAATLTLKAHTNIITNSAISSTFGALNIDLQADQPFDGVGSVTLNSTLTSLNGNISISSPGDITFNSGTNTINAGTGSATLTSGTWIHGDPFGAPTDIIAGSVILNGTNGIFANSGSAQFTVKTPSLSFSNSGTGLVRIHNSFVGATSVTGSNNSSDIIIQNTDSTNALTVGNITASNGLISLSSDVIDITGAVDAGTNIVYLKNFTNNAAISLEGSALFDINSIELGNITASAIHIGQDTFGNYASTIDVATVAPVNVGAKTLRVSGTNGITFGANNFSATGGDVTFKSLTGNITTGTGLVSSDILVLEGAGIMSVGNGGITTTNYAGLNGGDVFISGTVTSPIFYLSVFTPATAISIGGGQPFNIAQADIDFISAGTTHIGNNPYVNNTNNVNISTAGTIDFGATNLIVKADNGILIGDNTFKATGGNIFVNSTAAGFDITTGVGNITANNVTFNSGRDIIINSGGITAVGSVTLNAANAIAQNGNLISSIASGAITLAATGQAITMSAGTSSSTINGTISYSSYGGDMTLALLNSDTSNTSLYSSSNILDNNGNGVVNVTANNLTVTSGANTSLDYQITGALDSTGVVGTADLRPFPGTTTTIPTTTQPSTNEPITTTVDNISNTTNNLGPEPLLAPPPPTAPLSDEPLEGPAPTGSDTTTVTEEGVQGEEPPPEETQVAVADEKKPPEQLAAKKLPICK